jgi:hypothetical protein
VCSDTLLSQVSTRESDKNLNDSNNSDKFKETQIAQNKKLLSEKKISIHCILSNNEDESCDMDFQMTPKASHENPFFRNNHSILSSEGKEQMFFNENLNSNFDSVTQSKINKDYLQGLLSQRDKIISEKNMKMSQRKIILNNLQTLMESKSERTILNFEKNEDYLCVPKSSNKKAKENLNLKKTTKSDLKNSDFGNEKNLDKKQKPENSSRVNMREIPVIKISKKTLEDEKEFEILEFDGNLRDSIRNLKEYALGESNEQLMNSHLQCKASERFNKLNFSFKKHQNHKNQICSESFCNGKCSMKIDILKNFFDNLSDNHLMKKEDVLAVLDEIFQEY